MEKWIWIKRLCRVPVIFSIAYLFCLISAQANVVGTDAQNFNAITSGLDFVTVHSSETLEPGITNLGLFLNVGVNTLPVFEDSSGSRTDISDTLWAADLNIGYGLLENWDIGLSLPQILSQSIDEDNVYRGYFEETGNTEVRVNSKYRIWGGEQRGVAVVGSVSFNRIENNPFTGSDPGPTYTFELVGDTFYKGIAYAGNIGYRKRNSGAPITGIPIEPFKDQYIYSIGASYHWAKHDVKLISEIFGSVPAENVEKQDNRSQSSLEFLMGAKYDISRSLAFHVGGGTALQQGTASPDWRVYTGINYAFGSVRKKSAQSVASQFEVEDKVVLDIHFDFDSDRLAGDTSKSILNELGEYLIVVKKFKLVIAGHTDSVGAEIYNLDLSMRRAQSVRSFLLNNYKKISPLQIEAQGFGETAPIADNSNFQGRQKNRRVEFKIIRK